MFPLCVYVHADELQLFRIQHIHLAQPQHYLDLNVIEVPDFALLQLPIIVIILQNN